MLGHPRGEMCLMLWSWHPDSLNPCKLPGMVHVSMEAVILGKSRAEQMSASKQCRTRSCEL